MVDKDPKINKLVEESGMITHFKTTNILRKKKWFVHVSPYYHDAISDSIRETDLISENQFLSSNILRNSSIQVNVQLFTECKFIKQEIVFWFDDIASENAIKYLDDETGLRIAHDMRGGDVEEGVFHHLASKSVAKLFSANSNKDDVIYKAMNQCLHSLLHYRKNGKKEIHHHFNDHRDVFSHIIQYPLIVCGNFDKFHEVKFLSTGEYSTEKLKDHFILETNYGEDYFLIDIVDINYLETFLGILEQEAKTLIQSYSFKHGK